MGISSHRVGPSYDTLTVVVQPWPDRTTYRVTRVHFDGPQRTNHRIASGQLALSPKQLLAITPAEMLQRIVSLMAKVDEVAAPPWGPQGEQLSLDLDLRV